MAFFLDFFAIKLIDNHYMMEFDLIAANQILNLTETTPAAHFKFL